MPGEVYGTTRLGARLHAPRVGAVGCDHMTISEFDVGHEAFVSFDQGALYELWPFQSRSKVPSGHNCQDRSSFHSTYLMNLGSDPTCYNFLAIVDFMTDHTHRILHVIFGNVVIGNRSHLPRSGRQEEYTFPAKPTCQII